MSTNRFHSLPARDERFFSAPPTQVPILIVGCGPCGLFTSYLLAQHGIRSAILDKHAGRLGQPKAHAINPRSLEIFRQAGLDVSKLRNLGAPADEAFWVRWVSDLRGEELGKIPYERQDKTVKILTPEPLFNVSQPILENFLEEAALGTGLVSIHRRWLWEDARLGAGGDLRSYVRNRDGDETTCFEIRSEYLIGADGSESSVRSKMPGIYFVTPGGLQMPRKYYRSIHCFANIRDVLQGMDRHSQLYFCCNSAHRSGIIAYGLSTSFVHVTLLSEAPLPTSKPLTSEECRKIVEPCVPSLDFKPDSVTIWFTLPRVATAYSCSGHKILIVGDAAHSFPPQGGLGVNTGIADAHNLVWKLGFCRKLSLNSSEKLLSSYTAERKPVAVANALQSAKNEDDFRKANDGLASVIDRAAERSMPLKEYIAEEDTQTEITGYIELNKPHFDSLALQLGYVYGEGDGTQLLPNISNFEPSVRPGARLPHVWLSDGTSILDHVPLGNFVVLHRGCKQFASAKEPPAGRFSEHDPMEIFALDVTALHAANKWCQLLGLSDSRNGLLIRPDQHILAYVDSQESALVWVRQFIGLE